MKFELLRIFLTVRGQPDLFTEKDMPIREDWLKMVFSEGFRFKCRNKDYFYEPDGTASDESGLIIGRIGRELTARENLPPEMGLKETERTSWKARRILIDPTDHEDGQKIACEMDSTSTKAEMIFKGLSDYINHRQPVSPYWMEVNSIIESNDFWEFLERNEGKVTSIKFELVAPNMFDVENDITKEMENLRDNEKAKKAKIEIISEDGLKTKTSTIRDLGEYASRGAGSILAKAMNNETFNSIKKTKTTNVPDNDDDPKTFFENIVSMVFRR